MQKRGKVLVVAMTIGLILMGFSLVPSNVSGDFTGNIWIRSNGEVEPIGAPISIVGNTYTMTDNIDGTLYIEASDIVLDGGGYAIRTTNYQGIHMLGQTGVTIRNFKLEGSFGQGILVISSSDIKINDNTLSSDRFGNHMIRLIDSQNSVVENNELSSTGYCQWSISLVECNNNIVKGNTLTTGTGQYGVGLTFSDGNEIIGNEISDFPSGIGLSDSRDNTIQWNTLSGSGISVNRADGSIVDNNVISECAKGISGGGSSGLEITDNTISGPSLGMEFSNTELCTISGNTINTAGSGIMMYSSIIGKNIISDNTISAGNYYSIFVSSNPETVVTNNICDYGGITLQFSEDSRIEGNTVTTTNEYIGGTYVQESPGTIVRDNTISGSRYGIYSQSNDIIISENTYTDTSIILGQITQNEVTGNVLSNGVIQLAAGGYLNTVNGNTITNSRWGIGIGRSDDNDIFGNILSNTNIGIQISQSTNNRIYGNEINDNEDVGILLLSDAENNVLLGNNLNNNGRGIVLSYAGNNNIISGNIISNSITHGIYHHVTDYTTITGNTITNSGSNGMYIFHNNNYNTVSGNTILNSGENGIHLWGTYNTVSGNIIDDSANAGLYLGGQNTEVIGNSFLNNNYGMYIHGYGSHTIQENTIEGNLASGIHLQGSTDNTIFHNNLIDNSVNGDDSNPSNNDWYDPFLLEGNYWSDYTGVDNGFGGRIAGDGIGDTMIPHPFADYDYYPFTKESGWLNQPPVADAGPDQEAILGETVEFDGSGSSDPDGDETIISYEWDFGDSDTGSGETTSHEYTSTGAFTVTLTVTDDFGATDTATMTVTVITPIESIQDLIRDVKAKKLPPGIENSLVKKLEGAIAALERGQNDVAINKLYSFIHEVEALRGKWIENEDADDWTAKAQRIIYIL